MMKPCFFISDAHLGLSNPAQETRKENALLEFMDFVARSGGTLFILGDLFDFWFEYGSVVPRRFGRVVRGLGLLSDSGVPVHYFAGNHDFWIGTYFTEELGVRVHRDPWETRLGGKRFWIGHGDGIMKKDRGYRLLKRVVRHPLSVASFRCLHPDAAFATAGFFSRLSRNHPAFPDRDADYLDFARNRFAEGFDCVVMAHTHRPLRIGERGRVYVNTGDWIRHFTYARYAGGRLSLERFRGEGPGAPARRLRRNPFSRGRI